MRRFLQWFRPAGRARGSRSWLSQSLGVEELGGGRGPAATGQRAPLGSRPDLEPLEQRLVLSSTRPAAITYNGVMHVFTTGNDGHVYDRYSANNGASWRWDDHGTAGGGFSGAPAVTIHGGNLHVYLTASNGHLYDHFWNGSWHMDDHGNGGGFLRGDPAVTTYSVGGTQWMHVFVVGQSGSQSGRLYDHRWNGSSWDWTNLGAAGPHQRRIVGTPAVTTYANNGQTEVLAFVRDSSGHLGAFYTFDNGAVWNFQDHGDPGVSLTSNPEVATYAVNGSTQLHVFVGAWDHLWDRWYDGTWHWSDRGSAGGYISRPAVTTYANGSVTQLHAFVTGAGSRLYDIYTNDGVNWHLDDHGNGGHSLYRDPAVFVDTANRLHVYMHEGNGDLYDHWWNSSSWNWFDWGKPNNRY